MPHAVVASPRASRAAIVTDLDCRRLRNLLGLLRARTDDVTFDDLELKLEEASIVDRHDVPPTVVTMNSTVAVLDLDSENMRHLSLVFPGTTAVGPGRVSVLAPAGVALLGAQVGDVVTWPTPGGRRRARLVTIDYQPEAVGSFEV